MHRHSKERLKAIMEKYPKIREFIRIGDFETLWKGLLDDNYNDILTGSTVLVWQPMYPCFFMTAFAETGIDCKLKEIPDYLATSPITQLYLFDLRIPDGVEKIRENAFWDCYKLTDIYIPNSVKVIGDDAFGLSINRIGMSSMPERNITIPARFKDDLDRIGINRQGYLDNVTFI